MNRLRVSFALIAIASLVAVAAAQDPTVFFGGLSNGSGKAAQNVSSTGVVSVVYDDFRLDADTAVTGLYGYFVFDLDAALAANANGVGLHYEIRTGMGAGDGGTLLYAGDAAATFRFLDFDESQRSLTFVQAPVGGIVLTPGTTYFLGLAVNGAAGQTFLAATDGADAVGGPIGNGNAFLDSDFFNADFAPTTSEIDGIANPNAHDFALGVRGVPVAISVPGPAPVVVFGSGALVLLRRRKRA